MRRTMSVLSLLCICVLSIEGVLAQNAPVKKDDKKGETKSLLTKDNWNIPISYFESTKEKDAPVVIMLPGKGDSRVKWNALATELNSKNQFAVITVDLRKQGEAKPGPGTPPAAKNSMVTKVDYEGMIAFDLEAVKKFIYEEHQAKKLNMRRLGIVAADQATAIAITYAAADWLKEPHDDAPTLANRTPRGQDVQTLVLLSPMDQLPGTAVPKILPALKLVGVTALLISGTTDKVAADKIYAGIGGTKQEGDDKKHLNIALETKVRGMQLLGQPVKVGAATVPTNAIITSYLSKRLAEPDIEWRDRKSRLE